MSIKNKVLVVFVAVGLGVFFSTSALAQARHAAHHGAGHRVHYSYHGHHGYHPGRHHGYHRGYHHGYRYGGWYGPGYVAAPGVSRSCRVIPRHRNNYGVWIPARRVCRVY